VHAASVVAWQLLKLPFFRKWSYKQRLRCAIQFTCIAGPC
jgi:hypothetical protein